MTCYFGTDLANRVMQENVEDDLLEVLDDLQETLIQIKEKNLSAGYVDSDMRKKFWSATYNLLMDEIEYIINDVDKTE
jgi:hypothetical protein